MKVKVFDEWCNLTTKQAAEVSKYLYKDGSLDVIEVINFGVALADAARVEEVMLGILKDTI